jgi:hypothetical protein
MAAHKGEKEAKNKDPIRANKTGINLIIVDLI